jgi:ribosomal protein L37E
MNGNRGCVKCGGIIYKGERGCVSCGYGRPERKSKPKQKVSSAQIVLGFINRKRT